MLNPEIRYTHNIVAALCSIERSKAALERLPVDPAWEKNQRFKARCNFVMEALALEGVTIAFDEVFDLLDGSSLVEGSEGAKSALGLKKALALVDIMAAQGWNALMLEWLLELNRLCLQGPPESDWHAGRWRPIQTWVVDEARNEIIFTPPSPESVEELTGSLLEWLKSAAARALHPVLRAGLAHRWLALVSPFVYGNMRAACLLARLVLKLEGYQAREWDSILGPFATYVSGYYRALAAGIPAPGFFHQDEPGMWLEYYAAGVEQVYRRLASASYYPLIGREKATVEASAPLTEAGEGLNERQLLILELGRRRQKFHRRDIRAELEVARHYNPKTISRDLTALVQRGYLKREGERKGARYILLKS